jgi:hypothetical protein
LTNCINSWRPNRRNCSSVTTSSARWSPSATLWDRTSIPFSIFQRKLKDSIWHWRTGIRSWTPPGNSFWISIGWMNRCFFLFRIKEHLCLFVILFAVIESLKLRLTQKEQEVEIYRKSSVQSYIRKNWFKKNLSNFKI